MIKSYENENRGFSTPEMIEMEVDKQMRKTRTRIETFSTPTILFRAYFEFILPIGVGIYSAYLLIAISLVPSAQPL